MIYDLADLASDLRAMNGVSNQKLWLKIKNGLDEDPHKFAKLISRVLELSCKQAIRENPKEAREILEAIGVALDGD